MTQTGAERSIATEFKSLLMKIDMGYNGKKCSLKPLIDRFGKLEESVARSYTRQSYCLDR
jgi:hypothetical protein